MLVLFLNEDYPFGYDWMIFNRRNALHKVAMPLFSRDHQPTAYLGSVAYFGRLPNQSSELHTGRTKMHLSIPLIVGAPK
jgi:hypothetical protein